MPERTHTHIAQQPKCKPFSIIQNNDNGLAFQVPDAYALITREASWSRKHRTTANPPLTLNIYLFTAMAVARSLARSRTLPTLPSLPAVTFGARFFLIRARFAILNTNIPSEHVRAVSKHKKEREKVPATKKW